MKDIYVIDYVNNGVGELLFFDNKIKADAIYIDIKKRVEKNKYDFNFIDFYKIKLKDKYYNLLKNNNINIFNNLYEKYTERENIELWDFMEQMGDTMLLKSYYNEF